MSDRIPTTWRCRLFGHRWRSTFPGAEWLPTPSWCVGGAEDFLACTRCGREWWRSEALDKLAMTILEKIAPEAGDECETPSRGQQ